MPLDKGQIVAAAMQLLQHDGLAGLTMRELAAKLEVQAPTLYWHFRNKVELQDAMAVEFYRRAAARAQRSGQDWRSWLLNFGHGLREELLLCPDAAMLCLTAHPEKPWRESASNFNQPLVDRGLSWSTAFRRMSSVMSLTLGFVATEQSEGLGPYLAEIFSPDQSFEEALSSMVKGWPDDLA